MSDTDVVERLRAAWVDLVVPVTKPDACILAGRVAREVLTYFGVRHELRTVEAIALNDAALAEVRAGRAMVEWPPEAWNVYVGKMSEGHGGAGWAGHLIVRTEAGLLDLSAAQLDRPAKQIRTGGPLLIAPDAFAMFTCPFYTGALAPLEEGHYLVWSDTENRGYRSARDWRRNYRDPAGRIIRRIRAELSVTLPDED